MSRTKTSRLLLSGIVAFVCCVLLFSYFLQSYRSPLSLAPSSASISGTTNTPNYAIATFLSTRDAGEALDHDPYFTATRVLAYQLLHQPQTCTERSIPFLVIVPPHVSETKRRVLHEEGATVIPVEVLTPHHWTAHPMEERWIDQFTKLRLFTFTEYSRILYMDSDMLLTRPLDDIWDEQVVQSPQRTKMNKSNIALPSDYIIAGTVDNERPGRKRPSPKTSHSRLNAGFMIFRPDMALFDYYVSVLEDANPKFDQSFMEMGLLNYAHREDGPMPWVTLPLGRYSNNWPQLIDAEDGSATLHDKFWDPGNKDWIDRGLVEMWWRVQGRMEGYWQEKAKRRPSIRGQV